MKIFLWSFYSNYPELVVMCSIPKSASVILNACCLYTVFWPKTSGAWFCLYAIIDLWPALFICSKLLSKNIMMKIVHNIVTLIRSQVFKSWRFSYISSANDGMLFLRPAAEAASSAGHKLHLCPGWGESSWMETTGWFFNIWASVGVGKNHTPNSGGTNAAFPSTTWKAWSWEYTSTS